MKYSKTFDLPLSKMQIIYKVIRIYIYIHIYLYFPLKADNKKYKRVDLKKIFRHASSFFEVIVKFDISICTAPPHPAFSLRAFLGRTVKSTSVLMTANLRKTELQSISL